MISFFKSPASIKAVQSIEKLDNTTINRLIWLFSRAELIESRELPGTFIGPRREMITPWSTNAVEITQNMGISGIQRIEEFFEVQAGYTDYDPMLQEKFETLNQTIFQIDKKPEPIKEINDIALFNYQEGLALNADEILYLEELSKKLGRLLTDSEIFGFSQVNSEHCRHKIFNGTFIIDGLQQELSLFQLIKRTTREHPNRVISAYKDNCAFFQGPFIEQFAPVNQNRPDYFATAPFESVISLKAETHNFPTTVEPFNGAATGSGGEIRDRLGGGKGAFPLAGTAVYMTAYPRLDKNRLWEKNLPARDWLYHAPDDILIKASNGASDFGNKFGQPLICGSCLTFEHFENDKKFGYDKVIMLAGGVGFAKKNDAIKDIPRPGDKIILLGGDNYRIGMGGGAVSSVDTGHFDHALELNAVQRSNPEMQKRVANAIRALAEQEKNPIVSIHDHGAGGHLNCLSELVEETGGHIEIDKLPVGDPTLSDKEIIGNESQERMGLVLREKDIRMLREIADRERTPMYEIGEATDDHLFVVEREKGKVKPLDLSLKDMFGNPPKTIMEDTRQAISYQPVTYDNEDIQKYLEQVLQLEQVACKDWLTNKVDRSVTGKVAKQQTAGPVQLPLNNLGVVALDYRGVKGVATSLGHAPAAALIHPGHGSVLSIAESLTNIIWAPIEGGLSGISLSANWMWPCKNPGEDARLYDAVQAASDFAVALGINIPTGKDSLSMTQKYKEGETVYAPGTVIITAAGEVTDIRKVVEPVIVADENTDILYIDLSKDAFKLGGSSFAQTVNKLGDEAPTVTDPEYFSQTFHVIQQLVKDGLILAGHDVSSGGLITALLEMTFSVNDCGLDLDLSTFEESELIKTLFSENPAVLIQVKKENGVVQILRDEGIGFHNLGSPATGRRIMRINDIHKIIEFDIDQMRDIWYHTSYLLDQRQSSENMAAKRYENYKNQPLSYRFPEGFTGNLATYGLEMNRKSASGIKAAIIREKGVNGDREMAWMMYLAGLDVKDVHMTDLISGRETLDDVNMIVFVGGFSNSDVLGSAKGWAGAFIYNQKAKEALDRFYSRQDTLSLGVCNGCQLMVELGIVNEGEASGRPRMLHNISNKFESAFINVDILENHSVMLNTLAGARLGIWVAHGEGRFSLPDEESKYHIPMKYSYDAYPGNPNGSDYHAAAICSHDGRHLAMMPHLERAVYPWNWPWYPKEHVQDEITPWIEAFVNAREWIRTHQR